MFEKQNQTRTVVILGVKAVPSLVAKTFTTIIKYNVVYLRIKSESYNLKARGPTT